MSERRERAAKALQEAVTELIQAVGKAAHAKLMADQAREQHLPNLFDIAQSHRRAEAAARTALDKAVAACATALEQGITLGDSDTKPKGE